MTRLGDMGYLRTGYQLRGAVDPVPDGPNRVVLLGDVQDDGIDWNRITRTHFVRARARARTEDFLVSGDIIIRSRGAHYGVVLVSDPPAGTVAAAPLFVLSIRYRDILPEYVAWYLNRPATRAILENMARGTSLPTISIKDLDDLEIPVPPVEVQEEIVQFVRLLQQERELSKRILELRSQMADAALDEIATGKARRKLPRASRPDRKMGPLEDE